MVVGDGMGALMPQGSMQAEYTSVNPSALATSVETQLWRHALLAWVVLPILVVVVAEVIPFTRSTCSTGFNLVSIIPLIFVEAHHLWAEHVSWKNLKGLLTPPELTVMRQLGVLQKRRAFVLLGFLEGVDLYTDLLFPFVARSCDAVLTARWGLSWREVPIIGGFASSSLQHARFWGCALSLCLINIVVTGYQGLCRLCDSEATRKHGWEDSNQRPDAETFFAWARSSSTAMLPSVALFCEAVADQRKWIYKDKDSKDSTEGRLKVAFGKMTLAQQQMLELHNIEEQDHIQAKAQEHYVRLLIVKVLLGNVLSLWLQSSFLALTFSQTVTGTREMVIFSMVVSGVTAIVRCVRVTGRIGAKGLLLSLVIIFFIAWTALKVYFAYECEDHVWNLSRVISGHQSGCVVLDKVEV